MKAKETDGGGTITYDILTNTSSTTNTITDGGTSPGADHA
jgi:hypothetical protein